MAAIGKVYEERLIIAIGSGGNGKSTFFNAIQDVLGDYAGTIRSELMIASNDSGKKFEYARLRGKRFIVAEELEEGKQLDTGAVKHLCSTGDINAQYKGNLISRSAFLSAYLDLTDEDVGKCYRRYSPLENIS